MYSINLVLFYEISDQLFSPRSARSFSLRSNLFCNRLNHRMVKHLEFQLDPWRLGSVYTRPWPCAFICHHCSHRDYFFNHPDQTNYPIRRKNTDQNTHYQHYLSFLEGLNRSFCRRKEKNSTGLYSSRLSADGPFRIGFITQEHFTVDSFELTAVYCPHSYNFSGNLFLVDPTRVYPMDMDPSQAMRLVVSGGVSQTGTI